MKYGGSMPGNEADVIARIPMQTNENEWARIVTVTEIRA